MKITKINSLSYRQPHFKANDNRNTTKYETFMRGIDDWTSQELNKIQQHSYKSRFDKEAAIEYVFFLRDIKINKFKETMEKSKKINWWQKILNKLL